MKKINQQTKKISDSCENKNTRGRAELGVYTAPQSLRRASFLLVAPSLPCTSVIQGTETHSTFPYHTYSPCSYLQKPTLAQPEPSQGN